MWENKIISHEDVAPDQLMANPYNFRLHPSMQQKALEGSIDKLGFIRSVTVNKNTGTVVDGHLRVILALRNNEPTIPVEYVDLTEEEEREALLLLDPISALANTDKEKMGELLSLVEGDGGLSEALKIIAENERVEYGPKQEADAEPQINRAEELREKWGVESGQLWQIGEHRLLCGDSTVREDVDRIMGGELARMVFTDPPYNVAYQDNESVESLKARNRRTDGLVVSNDSMTDNEFDKFLVDFLTLFPLVEGGSFYLCAPAGHTETQFRNALNSVSGLSLRECIVWVKDIFVFGRQDYHWRHESILYGWKDGAAHYFIDDRTQDTVWQMERPRQSKEHPTMKPVGLPEKAIKNSSQVNELVYEPFAGSGSTLIACQNLQRKCRAIEISPAYCAVILERMQEAFPGIEIKKIN